ncbi:non-ribosomal peptide synthetase [Actinomadura sp. DC4]|uniref:non-ribosomal peptide synthetase n=1 Tax=Actinomadura sp. DC4 TaxID=3055069 RepID=UPI0025B068D8|nr:non-ribosomal peptide synthetase [Actinomadura sp. DC4]MDN3358597.1 non-ribosomal peptide synthetase [Actinomadura sp. DC4]
MVGDDCGPPLVQAVRAYGARDPDRPAVFAAGRPVTYGELDRRSDSIARRLRRQAPAGPVAILAGRGVAFVAAVLGVWKAGAAFLPLDPGDPPAWSRRLARRAGVTVCLSGSPLDTLPDTVRLDLAEGDDESGEPLLTPAPADLAYVAATSGSTGEPRLVMVEHRGVDNLAAVQREAWGALPDGSRVLQYSRPTFDGIVFELVLALAHGARLDIVDRDATAGEALADLMRRQRITHAVLPAAVVRTLPEGALPDLDVLVSAGDVCLPETAARWAPAHRFFNGYGPTEATVCSTLHLVTSARPAVAIGRPVTGVRVVIGDGDEIQIGGAGTARGYLGDPVRTAERFVPDPETAGGVLFRTGDRGRIGSDGEVEFLGRLDDEVKVRGVRLQPVGVERALREVPGVREAAVISPKTDDRVLVAYVVPETDGLTGTAILTAAARTMAEDWVPDTVVLVEELPLTANGKVDRGRLAQSAAGTADETRTPTEHALAAIVAELLGVRRVGIHDHILDLGGHSLLVAQFVARVRTTLGHRLELKSVLDEGTIAKIAAELDRRV